MRSGVRLKSRAPAAGGARLTRCSQAVSAAGRWRPCCSSARSSTRPTRPRRLPFRKNPYSCSAVLRSSSAGRPVGGRVSLRCGQCLVGFAVTGASVGYGYRSRGRAASESAPPELRPSAWPLLVRTRRPSLLTPPEQPVDSAAPAGHGRHVALGDAVVSGSTNHAAGLSRCGSSSTRLPSPLSARAAAPIARRADGDDDSARAERDTTEPRRRPPPARKLNAPCSPATPSVVLDTPPVPPLAKFSVRTEARPPCRWRRTRPRMPAAAAPAECGCHAGGPHAAGMSRLRNPPSDARCTPTKKRPTS